VRPRQPDTPGKLVAHAYSYEHTELATYELLRRVAERAGDAEMAKVAGEIRAEERGAARKLADSWETTMRSETAKRSAEPRI
jgi:ferritin-like metal-binding protein YciE